MPLEYLDIPAFLRRQADPELSVGDRVRNYFETRVAGPEASDSLRWDDQADGPMMPKDFLTYLNSIPQTAWPQTYAELRDLCLPLEIVDWLDEIFASEYPTPIDEPVVIEAFLFALLEESVYRRIQGGKGPLQRLRRTLKQAFGQSQTRKETIHLQVLGDLVAYLKVIEPNRWPEAMQAESPAMTENAS